VGSDRVRFGALARGGLMIPWADAGSPVSAMPGDSEVREVCLTPGLLPRVSMARTNPAVLAE